MQREWRKLEAAQAQYQQGEQVLEKLVSAVFALLTSETETRDAPGMNTGHMKEDQE